VKSRSVNTLKHQKAKRSMDHFAGLDVSVKETSICIVDDGRQDRSGSKGGASEPEALLAVLKNLAYHFKRIGWKLDRCRNGCSALSPKQDCL